MDATDGPSKPVFFPVPLVRSPAQLTLSQLAAKRQAQALAPPPVARPAFASPTAEQTQVSGDDKESDEPTSDLPDYKIIQEGIGYISTVMEGNPEEARKIYMCVKNILLKTKDPHIQTMFSKLPASFKTLRGNYHIFASTALSGISSNSYVEKSRKVLGVSCHQCKSTKLVLELAHCFRLFTKRGTDEKRRCRKKFCESCLLKFYSLTMDQIRKKPWICVSCRNVCSCASCYRGKRRKEEKRLGTKIQEHLLNAGWIDPDQETPDVRPPEEAAVNEDIKVAATQISAQASTAASAPNVPVPTSPISSLAHAARLMKQSPPGSSSSGAANAPLPGNPAVVGSASAGTTSPAGETQNLYEELKKLLALQQALKAIAQQEPHTQLPGSTPASASAPVPLHVPVPVPPPVSSGASGLQLTSQVTETNTLQHTSASPGDKRKLAAPASAFDALDNSSKRAKADA